MNFINYKLIPRTKSIIEAKAKGKGKISLCLAHSDKFLQN